MPSGRTTLASSLTRVAAALAFAIAPAGAARADIFKCVDGSGHTTYQQTACPPSAKGGRLDVEADNGATRGKPEDEAIWAAAAREKNVLVGMPPRYVRLALGPPREQRPGKADENVAEVWSYPQPDAQVLRLGFRNGAVAWVRHDAADAGNEPVPDDEATQRALRRRNVAEGQDCSDIASTLGNPDKTEQVPEPGGAPSAVTRYTWEPAPGDPFVRTTVTCTAGRVGFVERMTVR